MSDIDDIPLLERPSFFDGQRLTADDLSAAQDYNRELRWLHNRSLHGWGIAVGFAVLGHRGDQSVKVDAGYAIDCMGRDLVSDGAIEMPIPAVASASDGTPATYYLTMSYAEEEQLVPVTRAGACKSSGAVRRREKPLFRWQDPNDTDPASRCRQGIDVVLASVHILNCRLVEDASSRERRDAVPPQQPYIACGRTRAGGTAWQLWPNDHAALGVVTTVVTSNAGFRNTPRYQAHVAGARMFQAKPGAIPFLVEGYVQLAQETASSFDLRITLPTGTTAGLAQAETFTADDYEALVSRIANEKGLLAQNILPATTTIGAGTTMLSFGNGPFGVFGPVGKLTSIDIKKALERISRRHGISFEELLDANGWDPGTVEIGANRTIAIPGPAIRLNPAEIFDPKFNLVDVLGKDLAWHVVWTGTEG
jgi:hypothetical protein